MKRVLLITYYFPPSTEIGSRRPYGLVKYLPEFGWEPVVLTPNNPSILHEGINIIETDYSDILSNIKTKFGLDPVQGLHDQLGIKVSKNYQYPTIKSKFIKLIRDIVSFPDEKKGWYKYALQSTIKLMDSNKVDIIISTSPPEISHIIASKLKRKYKVPWIADLRDPWTQDPNYSKTGFAKFIHKQLELKTLSSADALVTVTEPWVDTLRMLHKKSKIYCITNGYDQDDYSQLSCRPTDKFTITYTGLLYNGSRDPSQLLAVVAQLILENKINKDLIEIRFYTPEEEWLVDEIKKYNLDKVVTLFGLIPRIEVLKKQQESQVLLLLLSSKESEEGLCPAKLYEYMGVMRPVIAMGGNGGVVHDLLEKTNSGRFAESVDSLKHILMEYYEEYIKSGIVKSRSNNKIEDYTYRSITYKYSEILNGTIS